MRIISWNVNGIRAAEKKGFINWLKKDNPDILCVQETKASPEQLSDSLLNPYDYNVYWSSAEKKGYSGVGVYTKEKPIEVITDFGNSLLSKEGRIIMCRFNNFILFNVYFPNGKMGPHRLEYKLLFYKEFLEYIVKLMKKGEKIIICGDVNTAYKDIDLARPKENSKTSGFLPEERAWLDKYIKAGLIDTFREFNKQGGNYTWWSMMFKARDRNVGWRIDYFFISKNLQKNLKDAFILSDVFGSDHCPVGVEIGQ